MAPKYTKRKPKQARKVKKSMKKMKMIKAPIAQVHVFKRMGQTMALENNTTGLTQGITARTLSGSAFFPVLGTFATDFGTSAIQQYVGLPFTLENVVDYTDFVQLFDRYQIVGIKLKINLNYNSAEIAGTEYMPTLTYTVDKDDVLTSSLQDIQSNQLAKQWTFRGDGKPLNIYIRNPKFTYQVNKDPGSFTSAAGIQSGYIDCQNTNVEHYGLKMYINNFYSPKTTTQYIQIRIQPTFYLKFKDPN